MFILHAGITYAWSRASEEDQCSEISSTLIAQGTGSINQSSNTVSLNGTANERATPSSGSTGSLLRLDEFLLGVGGLGAVVGVTEDWGQNTQGGSVGEKCSQGNGRGLNGGEV